MRFLILSCAMESPPIYFKILISKRNLFFIRFWWSIPLFHHSANISLTSHWNLLLCLLFFFPHLLCLHYSFISLNCQYNLFTFYSFSVFYKMKHIFYCIFTSKLMFFLSFHPKKEKESHKRNSKSSLLLDSSTIFFARCFSFHNPLCTRSFQKICSHNSHNKYTNPT